MHIARGSRFGCDSREQTRGSTVGIGTPNRTAFVGGRVWTEGFAGSRPLDVLIEAERIVAVAPAGGLDLDGAERVDLSGRLLVPGFQDAHIHLGTGGQDLLTCDLTGLTTPEEVYAALAVYVDANPDLPWILGGGWNRRVFPYPEGPSRDTLDDIVGGRPAAISPFDRHGMWVNTAALEAAGIGDETPDPDDGVFRRDERGRLSGMVEEGAMAALRGAMPALSVRERATAILAAQEHLLSLGITSVQDALVGSGLGMFDQYEAYLELLRSRELKLRLTTALWWDASRGLAQIPELVARREALEGSAEADRIVADTVKIMVDGTDVVFMDAAALREATVALHALGFTVHYHSYGDATTHWVLDAVEAAIAAHGRGAGRHHIAHLFFVAEEDFARFAELGVTANIQGLWAGSGVPHDHLHASTMTADPQTREYAFGRLLAAGTRLAAGSDWPVTSPDPLRAVQAVAGLLTEAGERAHIEEHDRLDPVAMLGAFTSGSAFVNGRAGSTGRIAVGYLADLVVLDRDVLAGDDELRGASVDETWIAGRRQFRRG